MRGRGGKDRPLGRSEFVAGHTTPPSLRRRRGHLTGGYHTEVRLTIGFMLSLPLTKHLELYEVVG
jgi:hypothetical protein